MTRLEIREVTQDQLIDNQVLPEEETMLLKRFRLPMKSYAGFLGGKVVFYAGIIDYEEKRGEVWSKIMDFTYALSAVYYIRELMDYVMARYDYERIIASVLEDSPELHRWIEWMGFVSVGESKEVMGKGVHIYQWRGSK